MQTLTALAYALGTLTIGGSVPTAADTVTIGSVTYTWRASVSTTINEVKIGGTVAISAQNLYDAVNATAAALGVTVGSLTVANPDVVATSVTATTVVVKSKVPGRVGNFIPTTESGTNTSWGGTVLASGSGSMWLAISEILATAQIKSDLAQALKDLDGDPTAN